MLSTLGELGTPKYLPACKPGNDNIWETQRKLLTDETRRCKWNINRQRQPVCDEQKVASRQIERCFASLQTTESQTMESTLLSQLSVHDDPLTLPPPIQ
jgi:hypothetical protein